jgi:hypothetical protein
MAHQVKVVPVPQAQCLALYCLILRWSWVVNLMLQLLNETVPCTHWTEDDTWRWREKNLDLTHPEMYRFYWSYPTTRTHTNCWLTCTINKKSLQNVVFFSFPPDHGAFCDILNIKTFLIYTKICIFMQYMMQMPPTLKTDAVCSLQTSANTNQTSVSYLEAYNMDLQETHTF